MCNFKVLILISGRGSNLQSIFNKKANYYSICGVISNNPEALGGQFAKEMGIPYFPFKKSDFPSLTAFKEAIFKKALEQSPDLVVLAGYMQIIQTEFVQAFSDKIINIHPALLPKYPGLDTHARAIASHDTLHGCTVHLVNNELDSGAIIAQASCPLLTTDTPDTAASRVLPLEHSIYPWVVKNIATSNIKIHNGKIRYSEITQKEAKDNGFILNETHTTL